MRRDNRVASTTPSFRRETTRGGVGSVGGKGFSVAPTLPSSLSFRWIRVDGGNTLNASPLVIGIKAATIPTTVPDDLDPGEVDPATGVETTAPTGTFPDGVGYGTLATQAAGGAVSYSRILVRNGRSATPVNNIPSGWVFWETGQTVEIDMATTGVLTFMVIR